MRVHIILNEISYKLSNCTAQHPTSYSRSLLGEGSFLIIYALYAHRRLWADFACVYTINTMYIYIATCGGRIASLIQREISPTHFTRREQEVHRNPYACSTCIQRSANACFVIYYFFFPFVFPNSILLYTPVWRKDRSCTTLCSYYTVVSVVALLI